jgi:hypothetical protein
MLLCSDNTNTPEPTDSYLYHINNVSHESVLTDLIREELADWTTLHVKPHNNPNATRQQRTASTAVDVLGGTSICLDDPSLVLR